MDEDAKAGLAVLKAEIAKSQADPQWHQLLQETHDYYEQGTAFFPRGFKEDTEYGKEPSLLAQRLSIWESVQTLQNPHF